MLLLWAIPMTATWSETKIETRSSTAKGAKVTMVHFSAPW
jgi:hypothetical protein